MAVVVCSLNQEGSSINFKRLTDVKRWGIAGFSIVILFFVISAAGLLGIVENERVKRAAERSIQQDVEIEDAGGDLLVAVLDLRDAHRRIILEGLDAVGWAEFDAAVDSLLAEVDRTEQLGVADFAVMQPAEMRALIATYETEFRAATTLVVFDNPAFQRASDLGLSRIAELEQAAQQVNDLGEQLTSDSLKRVERASTRSRIVLISVLVGIGVIAMALTIISGSVMNRLQTAREQEQQSAHQLTVALQAKTDFIADASHELRTPLTMIRGNAQIALSENPPQPFRQALEEIQTDSRRLGRLVDDMLFLAQSDADRAPLEREYLPVGLLAKRLASSADALTRSHGRSIAIDLQGSGHLEVDPELIKQVVLIAIDNAAKHSSPDTTIALSSRTEGESLLIEIRDHGAGIATEELPRVFDRFYQVGERRERRKDGAGLGLPIAKSIVEAHGGQIAMHSSVGVGTTVSIRLPLTVEPPEPNS